MVRIYYNHIQSFFLRSLKTEGLWVLYKFRFVFKLSVFFLRKREKILYIYSVCFSHLIFHFGHFCWWKYEKNYVVFVYILQGKMEKNGMNITTDKRRDVWSRDFIIWKINSGLWAVVLAGLWNKRVWADYEQLLRSVL